MRFNQQNNTNFLKIIEHFGSTVLLPLVHKLDVHSIFGVFTGDSSMPMLDLLLAFARLVRVSLLIWLRLLCLILKSQGMCELAPCHRRIATGMRIGFRG